MWKPIPGFEQYEAGDNGLIRRAETQHVLANSRTKRPVTLCNGTATKTRSVAAWILTAFRGPKPSDQYVACHGPLGAADNSLGNLYWGTVHQNNSADRQRDKTVLNRNSHPQAKLTDEQVAECRKQVLDGEKTIRQLSREIDVAYNTIWSIVKGKKTNNYNSGQGCGPRHLTEETVVEIREQRVNATLRELAQKYKLSAAAVNNICRGKTYPKYGGPIVGGGANRKITDEEVNEMRTLREQGFSYQKIADRFDVNKTTAMNYLKRE